MTLKRLRFNENVECCHTCMYIDEYALNVNGEGDVPHGYDGTAFCCKFDIDKEETNDNREFISPVWVPCKKYKRCTERQADYKDVYDFKTQKIIENPNDISKIEMP